MNKKKHGILVYREADLIRNKGFINLLLDGANKVDLELSLVTLEKICWDIKNGASTFPSKDYFDENKQGASFLINRSVSPWLNEMAEDKGMTAFNSSFVARKANDKRLAHAYFFSKGIPMLQTIAVTKTSLLTDCPFPYPYVAKDPLGRGGTGVYHIRNHEELHCNLEHLVNELIIQPVCEKPGKDLRVYVVGNKIVGSVLRESRTDDLRANISTGGSSSLYALDETKTSLVKKMLESMHVDFAGIDFLFDRDGALLFNEMEDAVGCRSLYMNSSINIADVFMEHVKTTVSQTD